MCHFLQSHSIRLILLHYRNHHSSHVRSSYSRHSYGHSVRRQTPSADLLTIPFIMNNTNTIPPRRRTMMEDLRDRLARDRRIALRERRLVGNIL